ncbi:response regulator transcription factor [Lysobacter sp. S4-A87]|uniref:response regulator transcription factor n=1 Tax=Lysobacter sp. S4-A87 TaxID=2925843 RepID=UPI001F5312E3|nr:response regulator transcription factor [Lysobacter sp. S4-A87]UNK48022.1 response regulator transcription factor [Lysobacter sp. S4-A87]
MRILLVEDNACLANAIVLKLRRDGHALDWQADGFSASRVLRYQRFDLVVLDIGLPRMSGLELLAGLRKRGDTTPVLVVTARDRIEDRVQALDVGADDFLAKPFDLREFDARCRVLLRRSRGRASELVRVGGLDFDSAARRVTLDGAVIDLPNREFRLLEILIGRVGRVVSREEIGSGLFGFDDGAGPNAIELYVSRLRRRIAASRLRIVTVRGVGYRVEAGA